MSDVVSEKPKTVRELAAAVDSIIHPAQQAVLLWPYNLDSFRNLDGSLDDVKERGRSEREFHGVSLFEVAGLIRRRIELGVLGSQYRKVADRLDAFVTQELGVSRDSVVGFRVTVSMTDEYLRTNAPSVDSAPDSVGVVAGAEATALLEVVQEYPTFSKRVGSFFVESAAALKAELGIDFNDLLVGIPPEAATVFGLNHGDTVRLTTDGMTIILGDRVIKLVTQTSKGPFSANCGFSKGIREVTGLKDHRETGTGTAETIPFTVVIIKGQKVLWLKVSEKVA